MNTLCAAYFSKPCQTHRGLLSCAWLNLLSRLPQRSRQNCQERGIRIRVDVRLSYAQLVPWPRYIFLCKQLANLLPPVGGLLQKATTFMDRSAFSTLDNVSHIWAELGLPADAVKSLRLQGQGNGLPSSFKVGHLAQASIALSALAASLFHATRNDTSLARVTVALEYVVIEFISERLYTLDGKPLDMTRGSLAGLQKTADGHVRIHDAFPNHRKAALQLLDCDDNSDAETIRQQLETWKAIDLESVAFKHDAVVVALRSYEQWDATPQAQAIRDFPITITRIANGPAGFPDRIKSGNDKCLRGIRVLELSRVIAAPVAGRTLAAHGADVLWVTSPNLPDLPTLDRDVGRGKRTAQLDLSLEKDRQTMWDLLEDADVFIQSYRPGSLAAKGFSSKEVAARSKNGIVCASLCAWGTTGPWAGNRGFDSIVQTCSGINVSEAEYFGEGEPSKVLPCQALDHASGYFLATGIMAALYKRATEGGSYEVDVSLAGTGKYLRSLGQYEGRTGFTCGDYQQQKDVPEECLETRPTQFGELKAVKHSAQIGGVDVGWDIMPKPLGSDEAAWL